MIEAKLNTQYRDDDGSMINIDVVASYESVSNTIDLTYNGEPLICLPGHIVIAIADTIKKLEHLI